MRGRSKGWVCSHVTLFTPRVRLVGVLPWRRELSPEPLASPQRSYSSPHEAIACECVRRDWFWLAAYLSFLLWVVYCFYCGLFGAKLSPSTKDSSEATEPEVTELAASRRDATRCGRMVCMERRAGGGNHLDRMVRRLCRTIMKTCTQLSRCW